MAVRNIVKIDEEKCNGCGQCVDACAEGAIEIIDGKARLVSETYCDGLGACLGTCPMDAITIEQRHAEEFDEQKVQEHLKGQSQQREKPTGGFVCPGLAARTFEKKSEAADIETGGSGSELTQWPLQLHLVSPNAPYFKNADLLVAADCVSFAMGDFHERLLKGRSIVIACPKLDDTSPYVEKLAELIGSNDLKSITVAHMEVPCCSGLTRLVQAAITQSGTGIKFTDITISLAGEVKGSRVIAAVD